MVVEKEMLRYQDTERFTKLDRKILKDFGRDIIKFKGRSLSDFEDQGYRFVTFFLNNQDRVFLEKARTSEVAYVRTGLYLPDSYRHSTYEEQKEMLGELEERLHSRGAVHSRVVFPSVADCIEIVDFEKRRRVRQKFKTNPFGYDYKYIYTRTSTENDPSSTVIIGCDDLSLSPEEGLKGAAEGEFRGIHVQDYPKDNNLNSALFIMPIIIPSLQ